MSWYKAATPKKIGGGVELDPILNNNSWEAIQYAVQQGIASDYWNVGERKEIILNGTCRSRTFNNYKIYAYILGFNHNAELEGDNTVTFQIGFDALEGGNHIALCDSNYERTWGRGFCMGSSSSNSGGWNGSVIHKYTIPEFINCLPSDLQSVLKAVNKYTDNTGNGSGAAASITTTQDKVFLLAEYEIFGSNYYANPYEKNSQAQYDYYKNFNSKMYNDQNTGTAVYWWERSVYGYSTSDFCVVHNNGGADANICSYSWGFAPAFVVG